MSEMCWCGEHLNTAGECPADPWVIAWPKIMADLVRALYVHDAPAPEAFKKSQRPALDMGRPVCDADSGAAAGSRSDWDGSGVVRGASEGER